MMMLFRAPASDQPMMDEAKARRISMFESGLRSQLLRMEELLRRAANSIAALHWGCRLICAKDKAPS